MQEHRLAAIMFTDIVGFTALMGTDEDKAFHILRINREIHNTTIKRYNGTLIKEMGDGILSSFNSASDAVMCAIEIQQEAKTKNIPLKIGIHEGEVVFKDGDVLGDGVNVASRLEGLAGKGMVLISGEVYKNIRNKQGIRTEFLEEKILKNVQEPVKIYAVICESIPINQVIPQNLENRPENQKSIIVLPFVNMSPDPDQEYFSDGLTEEIITDLSHIHDLLVISRNSAMTFKGTGNTTKEIADKVKVHYVLEGSVRKAGNNLRITAQLIDATTDSHLWAEKYNGTLDDVFDIQEKVSRSIVDALKLKLTSEERQGIFTRPIDNIAAYDLHIRARNEMWRGTIEGLDRALELVKKGLEIMGDNEILYADSGQIYCLYIDMGIKIEKEENLFIKAEECIQRVFALNPESPYGHYLRGMIFRKKGDTQKAVREFKLSIAIDLNHTDSIIWLSWVYAHSGKVSAARPLIGKLLAIDPINPLNYFFSGLLEMMDGKFESGLKELYKASQMEEENPVFRYWIAKGLAYAQRYEEANKLFDQIEEESPETVWAKLGSFFKFALRNKKSETLQILTEEFKRMMQEDEMFTIWMAESYALINEKNEAIDWLEYGVNWGFINYPFLMDYDRFLSNIREEPRFQMLIFRVKYAWENFDV